LKAYSHDLRERVVRACDAGGLSRQQVADLFGVSVAWVRRLLQRRRETGSFAAKPRGGGASTKMTDDRRARLLVLVSEQPDATLAQLRDQLGVPVHPSTVARALDRLGWPLKKSLCGPPNRTGPTSGTSGPAGAAAPSGSIRRGSCSSMRPGRIRR
jgi:transposase